jgi:hypothetical protein
MQAVMARVFRRVIITVLFEVKFPILSTKHRLGNEPIDSIKNSAKRIVANIFI